MLSVFRCVLASLYEGVRPSVRLSVGWMARQMVIFFLMPKMVNFLHENHQSGPTLILVNVIDNYVKSIF